MPVFIKLDAAGLVTGVLRHAARPGPDWLEVVPARDQEVPAQVVMQPDGVEVLEEAHVRAFVAPPGTIGLRDGPAGLVRLSRMRAEGDELLSRPLPGVLTEEAGGWRITELPQGAQVEIHDLSGGEVLARVMPEGAGAEVSFSLTDPGRYAVEITAPAPYLPVTHLMEVP